MSDSKKATPVAFNRSLGREIDGSLASLSKQEWWSDLLAMWRPAGLPSGDYGLRLAIRNGTMNFYRRGQSIAKIGFDRSKEPYLELHVAYVTGKKGLGQHYVRLSNGDLTCKTYEGVPNSYDGPATLKQWIANAESYCGDEKRCVDDLVAWNQDVIDLEMGLPGFLPKRSTKKIAPRIDLVALEMSGGYDTIVFWEAKMMANDELRCQGNKEPEVFEQLDDYKTWIAQDGRVLQVSAAYKRNCQCLVAIHSEAQRLKLAIGKLGNSVLRVARSLEVPRVDPMPRVVIRDPSEDKSWEQNGHAKKLADAGYYVQLVQNDTEAAFILKGSA